MAILSVLSLLLAASTARAETKAKRTALAAHSIALNMEFLEAQRAGVPEKDSAALFPQVWTWKKPAFTNICSDFLADDTLLADAQKTNVDFVHWPGYFEAGNAVIITATEGFTAAQQALAALAYMETLNTTQVQLAFPDSAGCMKGDFTKMTLKDLVFRHMKWAGKSLAQKIIHTELDHSDFMILVGVSDSSTYGGAGDPSWVAPATWQEKCYFGDMENPVADVAAQASTALALISRVLIKHGNPEEQALGGIWGAKASRAYEYSKQMWKKYGDKATCTHSVAEDNCIGSGCTKVAGGKKVNGPCTLYTNSKNAKQNLFAAASALFLLTEDANYRREADEFFDWTYGSYLYNWNNVAQQGVVILSAALDVPGTNMTRAMYRDMLRQTTKNWAGCSLNGTASYNGNTFCKATPDGSAYPLDMPWGNSGTIMNGMCAAAMYQFMGIDPPSHPVYKAGSCFLRKQLGYFFNHKCNHTGACNTGPSSEGFSYQVGIGKHWPTEMHTRDASYPNFRNKQLPDANTLCGAQVSGPYAVQASPTAPVAAGTDIYYNDRSLFKESEPAVDYTASIMCATLGYAALPDDAFADCDAKVRSPFTGRA